MTAPRFLVEIIPMTLADYRLWLLLPHDVASDSLWLEPHEARCHPSETVIQNVSRLFQTLFDPASSIVHSTSWRYSGNEVILTYLAVVDPDYKLTQMWSAQPVARAELARGTRSRCGGRCGSLQRAGYTVRLGIGRRSVCQRGCRRALGSARTGWPGGARCGAFDRRAQ